MVVYLLPNITRHPLSLNRSWGYDAVFDVEVGGTEPLTFQWYKNEELLQNETGRNLTFRNVTKANEGSYHVRIMNPPMIPYYSEPASLAVFSNISNIPIR